jgi:hypothetical protein
VEWRKASKWDGDDDYLFPSIRHNGEHPVAPDSILKNYIRPALKELKINKRIGWHSFRHGLGTMLRQQGVARITMELYQQSVSEEKHSANALAVRGLLGDSLQSHSSALQERS